MGLTCFCFLFGTWYFKKKIYRVYTRRLSIYNCVWGQMGATIFDHIAMIVWLLSIFFGISNTSLDGTEYWPIIDLFFLLCGVFENSNNIFFLQSFMISKTIFSSFHIPKNLPFDIIIRHMIDNIFYDLKKMGLGQFICPTKIFVFLIKNWHRSTFLKYIFFSFIAFIMRLIFFSFE
jgi:hypothetical protein